MTVDGLCVGSGRSGSNQTVEAAAHLKHQQLGRSLPGRFERTGRTLRLPPSTKVVRLVIVFAEGTSEDPANGAREGFIDPAWDVASQ